MKTNIRETQILPSPKGGYVVRVLLRDAPMTEEAMLQIAVTVHMPEKGNPRLATIQQDVIRAAANELIEVLKTTFCARAAIDNRA